MNKLEVYTWALTTSSRWEFFLCDQVCCLVPPGTGAQTTSLCHIRFSVSAPGSCLFVGNREVTLLRLLIIPSTFEFDSENEIFFHNLRRRGPWGTIHTAQVSALPHVLSLWKQKWCITEGTSGEMLNWRRSWCVVGSGRWSQQDTTAWLVKQQKCIYLITVLEAGKSRSRCWQGCVHYETSALGLQAMAPSLCAHLGFPVTWASGEREEEVSHPLLIRSHIALGPHPYDLVYAYLHPKGPVSYLVTVRGRA